jgi:hypothetical protein
MSVRATEAYENDEMPKSKWTKKALLANIATYCDDYDIEVSDVVKTYLEKLSKDELFHRFYYCSSWHHTSKFFNATDFYSLDEAEFADFIEHPTDRTYRIVFGRGNHTVNSKKTYKTHRTAERRLEKAGFWWTGYVWHKALFTAHIEIVETEI